MRVSPLPAAGAAGGAGALPPLPAPLAAMLALPGAPALIEVRSQIPIGLGFGSSAGLCAAAERALLGRARSAVSGKPPAGETAAAVWRGAHEREKVFHGTPSGADTGLAIHPGMGFLSWAEAGRLPSYEPLPVSDLHLVVAAVPRRGATKAQVAAIAERMRAGDSATNDALRHLGQCSRAARELLLRPRLPAAELGAVADAAQRLLAGLGLADPLQDRLLRAGRGAGACGGKLSGAGGGGAFFLVCRGAAAAAPVLAAVRHRAAAAAHVIVDPDGTRLADPASRPCSIDRWLHRPPPADATFGTRRPVAGRPASGVT